MERTHCWTCGAKCERSEYTYAYSEDGTPMTGFSLHCPNNRWWKLSHSEFEVYY